MATHTYEERKRTQIMWENGAGVKEIGDTVKTSVSTIYMELQQGKIQKWLPNQRPCYAADLTQFRFRQSI